MIAKKILSLHKDSENMDMRPLFLLFATLWLSHAPLCAQHHDRLNMDLLSEYETEFWDNGHYSYVDRSLKLFVEDPFFVGQMECEERAMAYLYLGLAKIYRSDMSDQTKTYLEQACQQAILTYGENSRLEGLALTGLGRWYGGKDVNEAIACDKKAYSILITVCGEGSFEAAIAEQSLAYHFTLAGSLEEAERFFAKANASYETAGLCNSLMYARFLTERALLWTTKRDINSAINDLNLSSKLLSVFDREYHQKRTEVVPLETYIYHLGIAQYVHIEFGLYERAKDIGGQCLDLMDAAGLSQTADYASNMANMGAIYIYLKDKKNATKWYEKARTLYELLGITDDKGYKLTVRTLEWLRGN